jgi:hypothetical protein
LGKSNRPRQPVCTARFPHTVRRGVEKRGEAEPAEEGSEQESDDERGFEVAGERRGAGGEDREFEDDGGEAGVSHTVGVASSGRRVPNGVCVRI